MCDIHLYLNTICTPRIYFPVPGRDDLVLCWDTRQVVESIFKSVVELEKSFGLNSDGEVGRCSGGGYRS